MTALERWARQDTEWRAIGDEMVAATAGGFVSAYQVSLEQRKRMLARGERPVTYEEIVAEHEARKTAEPMPSQAEENEWADRPTPEDAAIQAVFPTRSDRHDLYMEAQRLVHDRHGKFALVAMVNWLLHRIEGRPVADSSGQAKQSVDSTWIARIAAHAIRERAELRMRGNSDEATHLFNIAQWLESDEGLKGIDAELATPFTPQAEPNHGKYDRDGGKP